MKVLLVDDDADQLLLRSLIVESIGCRSLTAETVEAGIELATIQRPECAVVDLRLPTVECGVQLLRKLKALDPDIQLILLPGSAETQWRDLLETGLVNEVIVKGTSTSVLVKKLQSLAAGQG